MSTPDEILHDISREYASRRRHITAERDGQALFNAIACFIDNPQQVLGSADPFYNDGNIPAAWEALTNFLTTP